MAINRPDTFSLAAALKVWMGNGADGVPVAVAEAVTQDDELTQGLGRPVPVGETPVGAGTRPTVVVAAPEPVLKETWGTVTV